MTDIWTNRLSEYLDGELDRTAQAALEAHLATCGHCSATLGELRQVVARAKALPDTPPATDLWAGIRAGMTPERAVVTARRFSFSVPQLLAASVALMLLSGGGAWLAVHSGQTVTPQPVPTFGNRPGPRPQFLPVDARTNAAIADLQSALAQNESRLDTATVRIVRENLALIDRAIADARVALQQDPSSAYLNLHLADTMRRKMDLLRRVNDLATARL